MPLTTVLSVPLLIGLAGSFGYGLARLRAPHQSRTRTAQATPRSLAWTAVLTVAFTLILTDRQVMASLWLQLLLLTIVPVAIGYLAGRFTARSRT